MDGRHPEGWRQAPFGELVELSVDLRPEGQEPTVLSCSKDRGLVPQLSLFGKRLASSNTRRYKRVRPGDFVYDPNLLWSGAIARSHLDLDGIVSPVYEVFRVSADVDGRFIETWLRSPLRIADYCRISDGTNTRRRRAAFSELQQMPIDLPPRTEQHAISAVLDAIDEAIERTEVVIAATESLRQALLHELLTRGLPGRHTEWRHVPSLGRVPACWDVVPLESLVEILDARRIPLNADERANMSGRYPYYGANGVVDHIDRWIFDEDDDLVLLAEDGGHFEEFSTRPIAYRVRGKCWVNNHAHVLKATNQALGSFLFHSLANKDLGTVINGSTRSKLTQADLRRIEIGVPHLDEASLIGSALDVLEVARASLGEELAKIADFKTSAADALLTGRVRVPARAGAAAV